MNFFFSESVYSGQCTAAITRFGMSVAVKHRAMCHFGRDVLAITLLSVCLLCTFLPSVKSIKCIIVHTNRGKLCVVGGENALCSLPAAPTIFLYLNLNEHLPGSYGQGSNLSSMFQEASYLETVEEQLKPDSPWWQKETKTHHFKNNFVVGCCLFTSWLLRFQR